MEETYVKAYDSIMCDKEMDLYESYLLCRYINKYSMHNGLIITSDAKDAEYLKIDRKYVGQKRRRLKELGYIDYVVKKGQPTVITLDKSIIKILNIKN